MKELIYFDNAATTPMLPEVVEVMQNAMLENYGNPSSTHAFGRKAKSSLESARKSIAKHFNVSSSEIVFTSSGTESDNFIVFNAVKCLGVKHIITSQLEHQAVLKSIDLMRKKYGIIVTFVNVDTEGKISLEHLEKLLKLKEEKTLVSLMMINNEIGNLLPMDKVSLLCRKYEALFHSDTVQAVGRYPIDLKEIPIDFIAGSAHKFHGPKGVGFVYFKKGHALQPMFYGGGQEKGVRSSTENVYAILGMQEALEIAYGAMEKDRLYILELKKYLISKLNSVIEGVEFNGLSSNLIQSSYIITSLRLPSHDKLILFNLDIAGVAVSGGSACQSGSSKGSHVLKAFLSESDAKKTSLRVSFNKFNTKEQIDCFVSQLYSLLRR